MGRLDELSPTSDGAIGPGASTPLAAPAVLAALDWLADAVLIVDTAGRVLHRNQAADQLLQRNDALWLARGQLEFRAASAQKSFTALLGTTAPSGTRTTARTFMAERPGTPIPYVVALRQSSYPDHTLVFVRDPDRSEQSGEHLLRATFGLTAAEARLGEALRLGTSAEAYALRTGVSPNTVYTHLRRLKDKCGERHIVGLVSLLHRVAAPMVLPDRPPDIQ